MNPEFEPIDLDEHMRCRAEVLATWEAWEHQPGNSAHVNAYVNACIAYFGDAHNDWAKYSSAVRRDGGTREQALDNWEENW